MEKDMGAFTWVGFGYSICSVYLSDYFLGFVSMKKLIIPLLLLPILAQAKDIAIAPNGMMGMTVLTDESCNLDKKLLAAYAYQQNQKIIYACWRVDGESVVFSHSFPQLPNILIKQFIKPPQWHSLDEPFSMCCISLPK
mgnify:FL=1